jgi:hypothetical protein
MFSKIVDLSHLLQFDESQKGDQIPLIQSSNPMPTERPIRSVHRDSRLGYPLGRDGTKNTACMH